MANFIIDGLDDLMDELENLKNMDEVAFKMIDESTPAVVKCMKKHINEAADRGYATGELEESVKATKAKLNNYGHFAAVLVRGVDSKGVRNGEKMAYLEYGTSKQDAHPIMAKVVNESEEEVLEKMQEVFDREVKL